MKTEYLNSLSKEELIKLIQEKQNELQEDKNEEEIEFVDNAMEIPDNDVFDELHDALQNFDTSLDDLIVDNDENNNTREVEYKEKELKNSKDSFESLYAKILENDFFNVFENHMEVIKRFSPENMPSLGKELQSWEDFYREHDSVANFLNVIYEKMPENKNKIEEFYDYVMNSDSIKKRNIKDDLQTTKLNFMFKDKITSYSYTSFSKEMFFILLDKLDKDMTVNNELKDKVKKDFAWSYFMKKNNEDVIRSLFERVNFTEKDVKWDGLISKILEEKRNLTYDNKDPDNEKANIIMDRTLFLLSRAGIINNWLNDMQYTPLITEEKKQKRLKQQWMGELENSEIEKYKNIGKNGELKYPHLEDMFCGFPNLYKVLSIGREKAILENNICSTKNIETSPSRKRI